MKIGKYNKRTTCGLCHSPKLEKVLDLGFMPHAGDFLKKSQVGREKYYPLKVWFCSNCSLVQIIDVIPPDTLFGDYKYLSSVSLQNHFVMYARQMRSKFLKKDSFVVEIGSNDGVLLVPLKKFGIKVLGVEPAKNVAKIAENRGINTKVAYFGEKVARKIVSAEGQADAIFANNVLAHIDDLDDVFKGIKILLKPKGIFVFEVHYLPELISKLQYDFFYNEHLSYFSATSMNPFLLRHGMEIFDIKKIPIHSGSIRAYVKLKNNKDFKIKNSLKKLLSEERKLKIDKKKTYTRFASKVLKHRQKLRKTIITYKRNGEKIVGYGASGRGNTLLNFNSIGNNQIDYIVDESPERQGRFTPGTHIPIVEPKIFRKDNVKYALLLAWNYQNKIIKKETKFLKKGGKFIIPLPKVRIYP